MLQPLDVGLVRSLKAKLSKVTDAVKPISVTGYYEHIGKTNFTTVFKQVYEESLSLAIIKNGFRRIGIYPYNPNAIYKTCLKPTVTTTSTPEIKDPIPNTAPNSPVFPPPSITGGANISATFEQPASPDIIEKSNNDPDFQVATYVLP